MKRYSFNTPLFSREKANQQVSLLKGPNNALTATPSSCSPSPAAAFL
jgi:hypothetical protein